MKKLLLKIKFLSVNRLRDSGMWLSCKLSDWSSSLWNRCFEGSQYELEVAEDTPEEYRSQRQQAWVNYLDNGPRGLLGIGDLDQKEAA